MKSLKGYVLIIGAATFWGISATIAKFLFSQHINTLVLVQMRMTFSCLALLVFFLIWKRSLLRVRVNDLYRFALMGIIGGAGSNFTYYFTIEQTNVATAILLQYLAPLLVLLYAALSHEEELTAVKLIAGLISLGGCFLAIVGKNFSILQISRLGLLSGLASALCWAFANVWLRRLLKYYNVWTCLIYAFIFASVFWMVFNPPWNIITAGYTSGLWGTYVGFAMISVLIPHSLYFGGIRYLTASRAIITATFEPIVAIVSAYIFLNEILSPVQIVGALLVIVAIGILQIGQEDAQVIEGPSPIP
ncbi:MAG: EamA family transporter [Ignavibacteria bacterium]|nr:EamA family transporter [Ignavibacteria bacterium]MBI3787576.1 EamA family transporter [Ignavibacteriales bacterium]